MVTPQGFQSDINALIEGNDMMMNDIMMNATPTPMGPLDDGNEYHNFMKREDDESLSSKEGDKVTGNIKSDEFVVENSKSERELNQDLDIDSCMTPMRNQEHIPVLSDEGTTTSDEENMNDDDDGIDDCIVTKGQSEEYANVQSDEFIVEEDENDMISNTLGKGKNDI